MEHQVVQHTPACPEDTELVLLQEQPCGWRLLEHPNSNPLNLRTVGTSWCGFLFYAGLEA